MKYLFVLAAAALFLPFALNASGVKNSIASWNFSEFLAENDFSALDKSLAKVKSDGDIDDEKMAIVREYKAIYEGKLKAARENKVYQAKLRELRTSPLNNGILPHSWQEHYRICTPFYQEVLKLSRNNRRRRAKISKYLFAYPPAKEHTVLYFDEFHFNQTVGDIYSWGTDCAVNRERLEQCSALVYGRGRRLIEIMNLAVETEDLPVAFGAATEINKIIKANFPSGSDYEFKNAVPVGI